LGFFADLRIQGSMISGVKGQEYYILIKINANLNSSIKGWEMFHERLVYLWSFHVLIG